MKGYILLADGMRLDGVLAGAQKTAIGWLVANTAVVGFQEMATDPAYKDRILAFTYPEVGNVGVTKAFSESSRLQVSGLVVKVLSEYRSHYLSEDSLENMLKRDGVPCLSGVDTRGLAVHMREQGEMPAAIAPDDANPEEIRKLLTALARPHFKPTEDPTTPPGNSGKKVAIINLGIRNSMLRQLSLCCQPAVLPYNADAEAVLAVGPKGVFISDGPSDVFPPAETVATIKALAGRVPMLACGLGHVALGVALGCKAAFLKRGHHGANYPVKNLNQGRVEVTEQRHSVVLERRSVTDNPKVQLLFENINDATVEGICTADGTSVGLQSTLAPAQAGMVNPQIKHFVDSLPEK